jgi:hypothetical protein
MQVVVQNDAGVPRDFLDDEQTAINILNSAFTNNITVTIKVGYGNYKGAALPSQNMSQGGINLGYVLTYQQLRTDLLTFGEPGFFNDTNLPNAPSINGMSNFMVSSSVAKIFGIPTTLSNIDGFVGIGTDLSAGPVRISAFLHEFGHALGRVPDIITSGGTQYFSELDLWRFTAPSQRYFDGNFTTTASTYFSLDGGAHKIANWGRTSNDSDFLNDTLTGNDPFNEIVGDFANLTQSDLYITEALGFRHSPPGNPPGNPPPPAGTTADMILRHGSDGKYQIYDIGQNRLLASYSLGQVGTDWDFHGRGGFFGRDAADMMLRNSGTGGIEIYDISNNNIASAAALGTVGLDFQLAGFGDFNHDGGTDMVLRNKNTGQFELYNIKDSAITSASNLGTVGLNFQVAGFGDFNADGTTDMMLRHTTTGQFELYTIVNNQIMSAFDIGTVGLDFAVAGFADFNQDGTTDMMLRNGNTGQFELYNIRNKAITSTFDIGTVGPDFEVTGFGPFHAAGASDMILRNANTGEFEVYDIVNNQITSANSLGTVGLDWSVGFGDGSSDQLVQAMAGFGDGYGDGAADASSAAAFGSEMSQQPLLTAPQFG